MFAFKGGVCVRILGIDPGYAIVGFGVLDYDGRNFRVVNFGAITTPAGMDFNRRLEMIYSDMCQIIDIYKPDALSMEKLFFNTLFYASFPFDSSSAAEINPLNSGCD